MKRKIGIEPTTEDINGTVRCAAKLPQQPRTWKTATGARTHGLQGRVMKRHAIAMNKCTKEHELREERDAQRKKDHGKM